MRGEGRGGVGREGRSERKGGVGRELGGYTMERRNEILRYKLQE